MTISNVMKMSELTKRVEDTVGKRRNCSLRAISPFLMVFSKDLYCRHVKTRACLGKDQPITKQQIFRLVQIDTNGRQHFKVHLK